MYASFRLVLSEHQAVFAQVSGIRLASFRQVLVEFLAISTIFWPVSGEC